ncbi:MAG: hypothetical protein LBQ30_08800 [Treponema sp.]|jgi:hypothetical protein|nr:hypothetical protein [Treponema sp.]
MMTNSPQVSGNTANSGGGGVLVANGTFFMINGTVSGNTATASGSYSGGGGVYVTSSGAFSKIGGALYGDTDNTHTGSMENTVIGEANKGNAVYVEKGTNSNADADVHLEKTVTADHNLSVTYSSPVQLQEFKNLTTEWLDAD